jgi:hypothetical protein
VHCTGCTQLFERLVFKRVFEMNFQNLWKSLQKSYLEYYGSKNCKTNFVILLITRSTV